MKRRWTIVGFDHPHRAKHLLLDYNLSDQQLVKKLKKAISEGCNLIQIKGFRDGDNVDQKLKGGD